MIFLERYSAHFYALLRIVSGLTFLAHGVQKHLSFPQAFPYPLNPMSSAAGYIELIAGTLIVLGLFAGPAAFVASGMAAVGYWMVHAPNGFYPIANGGELLVLYCFLFLFIASRGSGIWSIDSLRKRV